MVSVSVLSPLGCFRFSREGTCYRLPVATGLAASFLGPKGKRAEGGGLG